MPTSHPVRYAFFIIIGCVLLVFLCFAWPIIWYEIQTHRWEHQIRHHQNVEELRAWAASLIATYRASFNDGIKVTNRPPPGILTSGRNPRVFVQHDRLSETMFGPYHVTLAWEAGTFLPMWGLDIGDTNFVCSHKNPKMWAPGIYFFLEPP